ncbi:gamma-glutamyl-gamma-aminobutyrate hydrolase family protein [Brachybacterium hainanense]|uniref:Gamma-glutamyl-gamma-aminobutyrate hydrolase family protein n=1 Tax=Brachybacterium hainanense TaxID=1541174 RepID=A0ABV6RE22_9MICO
MARLSTRRPLIGITAGTTRMMSGAWAGHEAITLTEHYVRALREAGARVVVLAPQDPWSQEELAELDGLVLSGGRDLDPAAYGAGALETDLPPDPERDAFETALYRTARAAGVPVLGICRGLQIIAVAEGGTLHQHLPVDVPAYPGTGQAPTAVEVELSAASDLALALGTRPAATAFHHQAVAEVPAGLRAVGVHSGSGLVLALEAEEGSPVLAVQWHPELGGGAGLFDHFVAAARTGAGADTLRAGVR